MKNLRSYYCLLLCLLLLSACGKKGALIPPEALVPAPAQNLTVIQSGDDFRITWSAPDKEQGGRPLKNLAGFQLLRREVTPAGGDCPSCPESWKLLTSIDLDLPQAVTKSGDRFVYFDKGGKEGSRFQYRIIAISKNGGISRSVDAPLKNKLKPPPPPALTATLQPASIKLEFTPGKPAGSSPQGFNIYRRSLETAPPLLPFNPAPITSSTWEDQGLEYGRSYRYSATTVVQVGDESVESSRCEEIEMLFRLQELR